MKQKQTLWGGVLNILNTLDHNTWAIEVKISSPQFAVLGCDPGCWNRILVSDIGRWRVKEGREDKVAIHTCSQCPWHIFLKLRGFRIRLWCPRCINRADLGSGYRSTNEFLIDFVVLHYVLVDRKIWKFDKKKHSLENYWCWVGILSFIHPEINYPYMALFRSQQEKYRPAMHESAYLRCSKWQSSKCMSLVNM